ncbi:hypothetical protein LTR65_006590 [Meristemomyces frigidus]
MAGTALFLYFPTILAKYAAGGITFEAIADSQKSQWMKEKQEKKHIEGFLARSL